MITQAQIQVETTDALTDEQVLSLELLVKQSAVYVRSPGYWPDLNTRLIAEKASPSVKTKGLKAVITAANILPGLVVETDGDTVFTTPSNWNALALDVLNLLYDTMYIGPNNNYRLVQRPTENLLLTDTDTGVL